MDAVEEKTLQNTVSAVLETLGDEQNVRVALLFPHTARKLVKESVDSEGTGILSNLSDSILVDLPFRNLLYESRKVQRLYYELDKKDEELYRKSNPISNSLLLIDPIRLLNVLDMDMNQAQRSLFMKCFTPRIWIIFLRLVSLGVGSRMRDLYSAKKNKTTSDLFLKDLENFQLCLIEMVIQVSRCEPKMNTPSEIEKTILTGCKAIYKFAQKMKENWGTHFGETPFLNELIPYLDKCMAHIDLLLMNNDPQIQRDYLKSDHEHNTDNNQERLFLEATRPVSATGSRGFDELTQPGNIQLGSLYGTEQVPREVYTSLYLNEGQNPLDITPNVTSSNFRNDPDFARVLQDLRKAIVSVATKSATLISLMKLRILENRQNEFQVPGTFAFINNDVLRKGFETCTLDEFEAVPLLLLSHCLGAYCVREWVMRFLVDLKFDKISQFLLDESDLSVNSYGLRESAYFRTAGQTSPKLGDYFTLFPPELKNYMRQLSRL